MRPRLLLSGVLLAVALGPDVAAGLGPDGLENLTGVRVQIEALDEDARAAGLEAAALQKDVERQLGVIGIQVLDDMAAAFVPGSPYLFVSVNVLDVGVGDASVFCVMISLNERVSLQRDPANSVVAKTWDHSLVGVGANPAGNEIRQSIRDILNSLLTDYRAANAR